MNNHTNTFEAVTASTATAATGAAAVWLGHADHAIHTLTGLAMLLWWARLWFSKPKTKPPTL